MSSDLERWEAEVNDYRTQLETVRSSLHNDPDNAELRSLQAEIEEIISLTQQEIDAAYAREAAAATTAVPKNPAAAPGAQKWDKDKHPAFQPGYKRPGAPASPGEDAPVQTAFQVNDTVLAKWATGDKAFYPARITSITGSAANPVYLVTFKSYGNSETLRGADVKAMGGDTKKRKAEGAPAGATPPPAAPAAAAPGVISAAASINAELASQVRREPSRVGDGPTRPPKVPRKVKATRELEAGKSKWQEFATKGKLGKTAKKDSMFRTGESVNARVGFTGSGQAMRKDAARSRHIYQAADEEN